MKRFLTAQVAAVALVLGIGAGAQAGPIPPSQVQWTYSFTPGAPQVFADGGPTGGVTFTSESPNTAMGNSDVVATDLKVFSNAMASNPDTLTHSGGYSISMMLGTSVNGSPSSTTLTFTGKLGNGPGGYAFTNSNSQVTNVFGPNATQTITLEGYNFTVSLDAYTPPGPPSQGNKGSIGATVSISPAGIGPASTPEPSTLLLSGLGFSFLGGAAWRKRRKARTAPAA
jgi:hypothetical protein